MPSNSSSPLAPSLTWRSLTDMWEVVGGLPGGRIGEGGERPGQGWSGAVCWKQDRNPLADSQSCREKFDRNRDITMELGMYNFKVLSDLSSTEPIDVFENCSLAGKEI